MFQDPNLVPDHLRNWKSNEIIWNPGEQEEEDTSCFTFESVDEISTSLASGKELVIITGLEKSRKTLLLQCMLLSAYITTKSRTLGYHLDLEGPILHFDTEQEVRWVKSNRRRFHYLTGQKENDPYYRTFSLKGMTSSQMIDFITHTIEAVTLETGIPPSVIAIDQIVDLMPGRDENNSEGADNVINHINLWTKMTGAMMIVIIHTNRAGQNTNGKIGAMLDKKCDCQFHVSLDTESMICTVTHKHARGKRIPAFTFHQDEFGNPEFLKSLEKDYKL